MATGLVIPHETGLEPFVQEFRGLPSYQVAVGGFVEPIRIERPPLTLFVNEEGKLRHLPINERATALWWLLAPASQGADHIVGDVAIVGAPGRSGNERDIPADFLQLVLATPAYRIEVWTSDQPQSWRIWALTGGSYFDAVWQALEAADELTPVHRVRVVAAE